MKDFTMNYCHRFQSCLFVFVGLIAFSSSGQGQTILVGGSTLNGDFNADTSSIDSRSFAETPNWVNLGTGGDTAEATRTNLQFDGTRAGVIREFGGEQILGLETGYSIADGDIFNINYVWRDAFNWDDPTDQISVSLFTTSDDTLTGARSDLVNSLSGRSYVDNFWEPVTANSLYTASAADAGKNLFVEVAPLDGNGNANGFARIDNFELSQGLIISPPTGTPNDPSPLTGINLFSDTFNRPDSVNTLDASTTGMSSAVFTPATGSTYAEFNGSFGTATTDIGSSKMQLGVGLGETIAGIDRNFTDQEILDAGGFAIEAIVDPLTGSNGRFDNRFAAIAVGLSQATATMQTTVGGVGNANADRQILEQGAFTFTIEDDGQYNAFDSYAKDAEAANPGPPANIGNQGSSEFGNTKTHDNASVISDGVNPGQNDFLAQIGETIEQDEYKVRLEFAFSDFNEGTDVVVTAFIEDTQIDLDPSDGIEVNPEDRDTYTFQWDGTNQNYIAFEGRAFEDSATSFDFLMIETLGLAGDFDADGDVDGADFLKWQRDGLSASDLADWQSNYGTPAVLAAATAVPEPSSLVLLISLAIVGQLRLERLL